MSRRDMLSEIRGGPHQSLFKVAVRRIGKRWLAWRFRHFDPENEPECEVAVAGLRLRVLPEVFNPSLHFTSAFFSRFLRQSVTVVSSRKVLEVGTGSGVLAISAALSGAGQVVAVDINPTAVECARSNVHRYGLNGVIDVRHGDMFEPVFGEMFDLVLCNPPYLRGEASSVAGYAYWGGLNLEWLSRFGNELHAILRPTGSCVLSLSDSADLRAILAILLECEWHVEEIARRDIMVETIYLFRLTENC